jgi:hypothetical protein
VEWFDVLYLKAENIMFNDKDDALTMTVSNLQPCKDLLEDGKLEIIFGLYVPDNVEHWQVFDDDAQIIRFINNLQEFSKNEIDWTKGVENKEQLIENMLLSILVPLERMFDRHDMYKEKKEMVKPNEYMEVNIGSPEIPKIVKIGKGTSSKERREIENLIIEY